MIAYDLICSQGHIFEGWFEDAKTYTKQKKKGLVTCPICNDTAVSRQPSTFAIKSGPPATQGADLAALGRQIYDFVEKNFDNVGSDFAKEALKIHYGVSEPRNIRGVSTKQEEETLQKEGVDFVKVPLPASTKDS
ncbi:MAG: DUF1178 family protein [Desulfobacterales bacterium]|jgi:hypothetical protein